MTVADTIARFVATLRATRQDEDAVCALTLEWPEETGTTGSHYVLRHLPWLESDDGTSALDTAAWRDLFTAVLVETGESFAPGTDIRRRAAILHNDLAAVDGRHHCTRTGDWAPVRWLEALVLAVLERDRDRLDERYAREAACERYADAQASAVLGGLSQGDAYYLAQEAAGCLPHNDASWATYWARRNDPPEPEPEPEPPAPDPKGSTDIRLDYVALDGASKHRTYKTLAGARRFAWRWAGRHPEVGSTYAVTFDGVGKVSWSGTLDGKPVTPEDLWPSA